MRVFLRLIASSLVLLAAPSAAMPATAQTPPATPPPIEYKLSFADAAHHVMQVEVTFPDVKADPLQVRMARSSPGRYAAHDFAKNVFDVKVTDGKGKALVAGRPNPHQWDITGHGGTVRITSSGARSPAWKSTECPMDPWLTTVTTNRSPTRPWRVGPGTAPL